jgi:hypothetical protein
MRTRGLAAIAGAGVIAWAGLAGPGIAGAARAVAAPAHQGILPPRNPGRSLPPVPSFLSMRSCAHGKDGPGCNSAVLKAVARARRRLEKMGGMSFSLRAYERLTPAEQLFVTVNLERVARGLPPAVVLTRSLSKAAQIGANHDADPPFSKIPDPLPGGGRVAGAGGNWAGGWDNALGADYAWMYDDGLNSPNINCSKAHRKDCWGHRDNILGTFSSSRICGGHQHELAMGAGHVTRGKAFGDSETELLVGVCGRTPTDVILTWQRARSLLHVRV